MVEIINQFSLSNHQVVIVVFSYEKTTMISFLFIKTQTIPPNNNKIITIIKNSFIYSLNFISLTGKTINTKIFLLIITLVFLLKCFIQYFSPSLFLFSHFTQTSKLSFQKTKQHYLQSIFKLTISRMLHCDTNPILQSTSVFFSIIKIINKSKSKTTKFCS